MRIINKARVTLITLSTAVFLTACGGDSADHDFTQPLETVASTAPHGPIFDPAAQKIPTTNDLLFRGSTDGTLNIPNPDNNPVLAAINELDGFSTTIPMTAEFGMSLDPASLTIGDSIRVFEVTKNAQGAVTSVLRELTPAEMVAAPTGEGASTLALVPRVPLKESTGYLVVLTNGIKDPSGAAAQAPSAYSLARSTAPLVGSDFEELEELRQLVNNMEANAASQGVDKSKIILSWSFTTQSITAVLNAVEAGVTASDIVVVPANKTTKDANPALPGIADIHIGTLNLPYYLEQDAPLTGYWKGVGGSSLTRFNATPVVNSTLKTPVMMTTPNAGSGHEMPAEGWPIVIYQHGITRMRTDMLGYADAMAQAGFAVIAIDLPLHGIPKTLTVGEGTVIPNPFHADNTPFPDDVEPTLGIDNNDDGIVDESGEHFINLTSLLTSRDNARQGTANLLVLRRSLEGIPNIDADKVGFVAHSLGGIVGVPFLSLETKALPSSLVTTGASISTILLESVSFGPPIKDGLAALGVTGAAYLEFLQGTQWVVDSADPANYAMDAASTHPIHMMEIIGGGVHAPDKTVPNSSTDILAGLLGATQVSAPVNPVTIGSPVIVKFIQGDHSSILDPTRDVPDGFSSYLNVFTEMHAQLVKFQASGGTAVVIGDSSIIESN